MRVSVNLATRPFADLAPTLKRLRIAMAALAVLSAGFWLEIHLLHNKAEAARAREHSLDGAIAQLNQERQSYQSQLQQPQNAGAISQAESLNKLFDEKSFSWTLAMEDLETVLPGGVQVTSLEPVRGKDGTITLHLRVLGQRDRAVGLVENLERSRRFAKPRIVNETAETGSGPAERIEPVSATNRVNFDLLADYVPATPEERTKATKKHTAAEDRQALPKPGLQKSAPFHTGPGAKRLPYTDGKGRTR
jgi:type IV pilus assembly protein PilN